MKFKEWFEKKLVVGGFPFMVNPFFTASKYDYVINVSDEYYPNIDMQITTEGCKTFWFPMNEVKKDIGLNSIYAALYIISLAEKENKRVYLHCHAGSNRSMAVQAAYYYMRTGEHLITGMNGYLNKLCAMCHRGYLPPKSEMEQFLTLLGKYYSKNRMIGGLLDECKIDTINNF